MVYDKTRVTGIVSLALSIHLLCHGCSSVETPFQQQDLGKTGIVCVYSPAISHYDKYGEGLAQLFVDAHPDEDALDVFKQRIESLLGKRLVRLNPPSLRDVRAVSYSEYLAISQEYFIDSLIILHIYPGEVSRRRNTEKLAWSWVFSLYSTARIVDLAKGKVLWETAAEAPFDEIGHSPQATIVDKACRSQATSLANRLADELSILFQEAALQG